MALVIVAGIVAVGGLLYVMAGGLSAPWFVVVVGVACYVLALVEMVRRLRAGDASGLAVPVAVLVGWTVLLLAGGPLFGWAP